MIGMSGVRGLRDGRFCVGFALFTANTRHSRVVPRGRSIKAALDCLASWPQAEFLQAVSATNFP